MLDHHNFQILKIYLDSHCIYKKIGTELYINIKNIIGKIKVIFK